MKRTDFRIRPHTAKQLSSFEKNPFQLYSLSNPVEKAVNETLITLQNPTNQSQYGMDCGQAKNTGMKNYSAYLVNNNKRGLRSDKQFYGFRNMMKTLANNSKKEVQEARLQVKQIENQRFRSVPFSEKKKLSRSPSSPLNRLKNQKSFEKRIRNMSDKQNSKSTLNKIQEVIKELYEEKKRNKKIVKDYDHHKSPNTTNMNEKGRTSSRPKTRISESFEKNGQSVILADSAIEELGSGFIPRAVTKALDQLKTFIIDVPLLNNDDEPTYTRKNPSPSKDPQEPPQRFSYLRKASKVLPGNQYNNEKHLKEDLKLFKGKTARKLMRNFTEMANEEAHDKEMNYYLTLLKLREGEGSGEQKVVDFNDELRNIYKREAVIRNHGKAFQRKVRKLKGEMNEVDKKHFPKSQMSYLEQKIHRGLMRDYKNDQKKIIQNLVEKMRPNLNRKNTL